MSKIWFITGSSRGLGRSFAEAALARGDKVAATARDVASLDALTAYGDAVLPLKLDVTDKAAVFDAVRQARQHFGRLDVIVNNAGYGLFGAVEELSDKDLRDQLETNLFGPLWVVQAALPIMREQGGGHIIQISSTGGQVSLPLGGGYHASKFALEGLSDSLAQEVAGFGIKVTVVEPSFYATDGAAGAVNSAADPSTTASARASSRSPRPSTSETRPPRAERCSSSPTPTIHRCGCSSAPRAYG